MESVFDEFDEEELGLLIATCQSGDKTAEEKLHGLVLKHLQNYSRIICKDFDLEQNVVSHSVEKFYKNILSFEFQGKPELVGFLNRIAKHVHLDLLRAQKKIGEFCADIVEFANQNAMTPSKELRHRDAQKAAENALLEMNPDYRKAFLTYRFPPKELCNRSGNGMKLASYLDVADYLEISAGLSKQQRADKVRFRVEQATKLILKALSDFLSSRHC